MDLGDPRWEKFNELAERVDKLPLSERASWLDARVAAGDDPEIVDLLRRVVEDPFQTAQTKDGALSTVPPVMRRGSSEWQQDWNPGHGYVLLTLLGSGGFGCVWRALASGGKTVALKMVRLEEGKDIELKVLEQMNQHEIRHAHLIDIHQHWLLRHNRTEAASRQEARWLMVAMELADGTLLDRYEEVRKHGMRGIPPEELVKYMYDAAEALDYLNTAHKTKPAWQHQDIKPQNLLLVSGTVKVGDFGIAQVLKNTITSHHGGFSREYAAPERNEGKTSDWYDQYSLAVTYSHLRGTKQPWRNIENLAWLPDREQAALMRALAIEPDKRHRNCLTFVRELRRALEAIGRCGDVGHVSSRSISPAAEAIPETLVPWAELAAKDRAKIEQLLTHLAHGEFTSLHTMCLNAPSAPRANPLLRAVREFCIRAFELKMDLTADNRKNVREGLENCLGALSRDPGLYAAYGERLRHAVSSWAVVLVSLARSREVRELILTELRRFATQQDNVLGRMLDDACPTR